MKKIIHICKNNHYFINEEHCPICDAPIKEDIEYLPGDCIACGQLCSENTYCCNSPEPIDASAFQDF